MKVHANWCYWFLLPLNLNCCNFIILRLKCFIQTFHLENQNQIFFSRRDFPKNLRSTWLKKFLQHFLPFSPITPRLEYKIIFNRTFSSPQNVSLFPRHWEIPQFLTNNTLTLLIMLHPDFIFRFRFHWHFFKIPLRDLILSLTFIIVSTEIIFFYQCHITSLLISRN